MNLVAQNDLYIWIDESGTLSKNRKNPQTYVYAGYWCLEKDRNAIESTFASLLVRMFPGARNNEKKASNMKYRKKKILIQNVVAKHPNEFHPVFLREDLEQINRPLLDKRDIQLHKNYLLRRFVERCVRDFRNVHSTTQPATAVYVNIDDQSKTTLQGFDPFPQYLNKYFKQQYSYNFLQSDANFEVKYMNSAKYRGIQLADVLANCKYNHYIHGRNELHQVLPKFGVPVVKLP